MSTNQADTSEARLHERMAREYLQAARRSDLPELVRTSLWLQSAELLVRWRLAEGAEDGRVPEPFRTGHRVAAMLAALGREGRWANAVGSLEGSSWAWWAKVAAVDKYLAAFRYPCPPYDDTDVPALAGDEPSYPTPETGERFRRECELLWEKLGGGDDPAASRR